MNSLIILPSECVGQTSAELLAERALYAYQTHELRVGQELKVAALGGLRGTAVVTHASPTLVQLDISLTEPPLSRKPIDLIVGLSRPQTVKKVIQAAVMLGVRSLHFVLSATGEKSYRSSHALQDKYIELETIKALEQIWDSCAPVVSMHYSLRRLFQSDLFARAAGRSVVRLLADPSGDSLASTASRLNAAAPTFVAIGPERGWTEEERHAFATESFIPVSLGARVLRVELALIFMLGQMDALGLGGTSAESLEK